MSVASLVQRKIGISWPSDMLGVSLHLIVSFFKDSWQFSTNFSSWSFRPGQYTASLPSACTSSDPGDLHESIQAFLLVSCLGPQFLSLLI